ncbi:motility protein A [Desulfobaculum bizertense]|uniref:Chemotaxis protein MotA n=1 Tax=Desulfobaculum bizertense DSM 18034 TaxID=1121442 RepID=A0A1T4VYB0_9BACT|nr:MotA/TolQ/ExbB proton channel family protein [Desulfobaculum bizertense]UIJ36977.1 MotA/TolQ/ExbB proton channel family protein [Desulfobaculum bizertense]SKA69917.1 chemotaxis protein MotA [Desulfobaculum bizertense DSM 18034]
MDIGTLLGILAGFGLIVGSILFGDGNIAGFFDVPSILVVVGGTMATAFIMFPMKVVFGSFKVAMNAFFSSNMDASGMIDQMVGLAEKARKESLVALEKVPIENPFIKKGITLVADGTEEPLIRAVMQTEISFMKQRHRQGQGVFKGMGTMAPAFGMIGTLIGLVKMLQNLSDPSSIGPAMAVALLTTFYGAVLANVAFLPLAKKLEERSQEEVLFMEIAMEGVVSILHGEHPQIVREKLLAFLSPALRGQD